MKERVNKARAKNLPNLQKYSVFFVKCHQLTYETKPFWTQKNTNVHN